MCSQITWLSSPKHPAHCPWNLWGVAKHIWRCLLKHKLWVPLAPGNVCCVGGERHEVKEGGPVVGTGRMFHRGA